MKLKNLSKMVITAVATMVIFGCGGGGGGSNSPSAPVVPKAVVTVGLTGVLNPEQFIGSVVFVLNLPAGVTAQTKPAPALAGEIADTVLALTGTAVGGTASGNYTAASGSIEIIIVKVAGFSTGNFVTLNLDYTGADPVSSGFSITGLTAFDAGNVSITTLTPGLTLQVIK